MFSLSVASGHGTCCFTLHGSLLNPSSDLIELPIIGDENTTHEVSLEVVHNVIYARVEETLMILAQFIENSGLKDKIGAGIVLTGGFSQMEGMRELAVATFGSVPVRLAKPKEMDGLFDNLRSPEYSSAVGLVMYAASAYTQYEIDVNKRVRHSNEVHTGHSSINLTQEPDVSTPHLQEHDSDKKEGMVSISMKKSKKEDEAGAFNKFWNWATQLF